MLFIHAKLSSAFRALLQALLSLYGIIYFSELNQAAIFLISITTVNEMKDYMSRSELIALILSGV